jgi:hypothetical protein
VGHCEFTNIIGRKAVFKVELAKLGIIEKLKDVAQVTTIPVVIQKTNLPLDFSGQFPDLSMNLGTCFTAHLDGIQPAAAERPDLVDGASILS